MRDIITKSPTQQVLTEIFRSSNDTLRTDPLNGLGAKPDGGARMQMMNSETRRVPADNCPAKGVKARLAAAWLGLAASLILGLSACTGGTDDKAARIAPTAATASGSTGMAAEKLAFDGDITTVWNSGGYPPAWILFDLGKPVTLARVRLLVAQDPPGPTTHQISAGLTPDSLAAIGALDGNTAEGQWLEFNQATDNIRYVKITTLKSPSWVSWREVEFYK